MKILLGAVIIFVVLFLFVVIIIQQFELEKVESKEDGYNELIEILRKENLKKSKYIQELEDENVRIKIKNEEIRQSSVSHEAVKELVGNLNGTD